MGEFDFVDNLENCIDASPLAGAQAGVLAESNLINAIQKVAYRVLMALC